MYEAIGRDNARHRRQHSTNYIRSCLTVFDFIRRNHDYTYLESEEQKLRYCCGQLGIGKKILPAKRCSGAIKNSFSDRFFVDKFPMFYNPIPPLPPMVTFNFINPGFESLDSFKKYVDAYWTLFEHTGLRSREFFALCWSDADMEKCILTILAQMTGKTRVVPLNTRSMKVLGDQEMNRKNDFVFCNPTTVGASSI